jgi:CHAT domain-containing protein
MLVVILGDAAGEAPLPAVSQERDTLTRLFPHGHTLLEGRQATVANVRRHLKGHRWAHFSCHGTQDLDDPSKGGLVMDDGTLDIPTLSAEQGGGEFVFLSACKTATGGLGLPDEAISLSAALHYGGYRHVIGTLWSVYDQTAADVAAAVYRDLTAAGRFEPRRSAQALHHAVRSLRDAAGAAVSVWTPFTHTGP